MIFDPLKTIGLALGAGLFMSLLAGLALRLRTLRRHDGPPLCWLPPAAPVVRPFNRRRP